MIKYRKRSKNKKANAFSRRANYKESIVLHEKAILQNSQHGLVLKRKTMATNFKIYNKHQEKIIKKAYSRNNIVIRILKNFDNYKLFTLKQKLLKFKGLIYLLEDLKRRFVKRIYKALMHRYTGVLKTTKRVAKD